MTIGLALRTLARLFPVGDVCEGQIMVVEGKARTEAISNFWGWRVGGRGGLQREEEGEGEAEQLWALLSAKLSSVIPGLMLDLQASAHAVPQPVLPLQVLGFYPSRAAPVTSCVWAP